MNDQPTNEMTEEAPAPEANGEAPAAEPVQTVTGAPGAAAIVHIEQDHITLRLSERGRHVIKLAELSAQGDTVGLLLYALVVQAFDLTRGLEAIALNTGAAARLLHIGYVEAKKRAENPQAAAVQTFDQLLERFEKRLGIKVSR